MRSKLAEMAVLLIFATSSQAESVDYLGAGAPKLREFDDRRTTTCPIYEQRSPVDFRRDRPRCGICKAAAS